MRCYRACDRRFPFLWTDASQAPGRWHGAGEGPCHYLSTTAKGAWAEILRHGAIDELEDLLDLELVMWELEVPVPTGRPELSSDVLTGGTSSYPACRDEARRLREAGHGSLSAPSAALVSGEAEYFGVVGGTQVVRGIVPSQTFAFFGVPDALVGMPAAEGHPDPDVLDDVRPL